MSNFVEDTLKYGQAEMRARFGEMSETERRRFVTLALQEFECVDDLVRTIPAALGKINPKTIQKK